MPVRTRLCFEDPSIIEYYYTYYDNTYNKKGQKKY